MNRTIEVPLWLAIALRAGKNCDIVVPSFLQEDFLQQVAGFEAGHPDSFYVGLPDAFFQIAKSTLGHFSDCFERPEAVRILVQNIKELRWKKLTDVLLGHSLQKDRIILHGIGSGELAGLRDFLRQAVAIKSQLEDEHRSTVVREGRSSDSMRSSDSIRTVSSLTL